MNESLQTVIDETVESLLYVSEMDAIAEIIRSGNLELKRTYTNIAISRIERTIHHWPKSLSVVEMEKEALKNCKILSGILNNT